MMGVELFRVTDAPGGLGVVVGDPVLLDLTEVPESAPGSVALPVGIADMHAAVFARWGPRTGHQWRPSHGHGHTPAVNRRYRSAVCATT